jgi:hypothetical protein
VLEQRIKAAAPDPGVFGDLMLQTLRAWRTVRKTAERMGATRTEVQCHLRRLIRCGNRLALQNENEANDRLARDHRVVLEALGSDPATPEDVADRCGLVLADVRRRLAELWDGGLVEIVGRDDARPLFHRPIKTSTPVRRLHVRGAVCEKDPVALLAAGFGDIRALDRAALEQSPPLAAFWKRIGRD